MAFVALPRGIKLCWHFTLQNVPVSFCVHVQANTTVNQQDTANVAGIGRSWWNNTGYAVFSDDMAITRVIATDVSQEPAFQTILSGGFTQAVGGRAVESLPNGSAIVVTLNTGVIGRAYRGRVFLPGIDVGSVEQNTLFGGAPTGILGVMNQLRTDLATAQYPMGVASYQLNNVLRNPAVFTPVTGFTVRLNVKSQRRRNLPG